MNTDNNCQLPALIEKRDLHVEDVIELVLNGRIPMALLKPLISADHTPIEQIKMLEKWRSHSHPEYASMGKVTDILLNVANFLNTFSSVLVIDGEFCAATEGHIASKVTQVIHRKLHEVFDARKQHVPDKMVCDALRVEANRLITVARDVRLPINGHKMWKEVETYRTTDSGTRV